MPENSSAAENEP